MKTYGLKVGDIVEWTSQGAGWSTTKRGEIIYLGPRPFWGQGVLDIERRVTERALELTGSPKWRLHAGTLGGCGVVVLVTRPAKRGGFNLSWVYSPRVMGLRKVAT